MSRAGGAASSDWRKGSGQARIGLQRGIKVHDKALSTTPLHETYRDAQARLADDCSGASVFDGSGRRGHGSSSRLFKTHGRVPSS